MSQRVFDIGQRVDQWCATCAEQRGHVVASISVKGRVTRVRCPICGGRATFKNQDKSIAGYIRVEARPYDQRQTYRVKHLIEHKTYGVGEVVALVEPQKMDVLFADRLRRLIHSKA